MLGFRGHFSTKSRRYSTTLASLRDARRRWRVERGGTVVDGQPPDPSSDPTVDGSPEVNESDGIESIGNWRFVSRGHSPGEAIYAATIASDLADERRIARELSWSDERRDSS